MIHTVTLLEKETEDLWGKETPGAEIILERVRVEPSSRIVRDKNGAEIQLSATLFYDCINSRPQGVLFQEDDMVLFNGQRHRVQTVESLYDEKRIHHYEMGLISHA